MEKPPVEAGKRRLMEPFGILFKTLLTRGAAKVVRVPGVLYHYGAQGSRTLRLAEVHLAHRIEDRSTHLRAMGAASTRFASDSVTYSRGSTRLPSIALAAAVAGETR